MPEPTSDERSHLIVSSLLEAFEPLMRADPHGFRTKFRKMARDPFAFYRGTACLFYADVGEGGRYAGFDGDWVDGDTARIWIQGDLHAENFGTYLDADGRLVFDVNDFDEAYLGHWTWDLARFAASLALLCWQKALPDEVIGREWVLANASLDWFTRSAGSAAAVGYASQEGWGAEPENSGVPTAAIQFAHDIGIRRFAEASNRIVRWTDVEDRGGHFAALEEPDRLIDDLRAFLRPLR